MILSACVYHIMFSWKKICMLLKRLIDNSLVLNSPYKDIDQEVA